MYYLIRETLMETTLKDCTSGKYPYVAILSAKEWEKEKDAFTMGIDLDMTLEIDTTKAEVNYDSPYCYHDYLLPTIYYHWMVRNELCLYARTRVPLVLSNFIWGMYSSNSYWSYYFEEEKMVIVINKIFIHNIKK